MSFTKHILVPIDFSDAAGPALKASAVLARQNDAAVTVCHVFDPQALGPRGTRGEPGPEQIMTEGEVESEIHDALRDHAETHLAGREVQTAVLLNANAAAGICDYAAQNEVDLIVVSTHGRTGLAHMLIGSVAEKVVRHAPCPVLTLRSPIED